MILVSFFLLILVILFMKLLQPTDADGININFHQNDYQINFDRSGVNSYNKDYMRHFSVITFKYNRTCTAFNKSFAFRKSELVLNETVITFQYYKFASNEYRLFPARYQMYMCDMYAKDMGGVGTSTCRSYKECPIEQERNYSLCNYAPDPSKFPPFMPNGRYKVDMEATCGSVELWSIYALFEISRPIV